jgi:hypothetical protein
MLPVTQDKFGDKEGNCFAACLASILHLPLESVPNFCSKPSTWWDDTNKWLAKDGLRLLSMQAEGDWQAAVLEGLYVIYSGKGPRGFNHCCVGLNGIIVWDPHPSRDGLEKIELVDLFIATAPEQRTVRGCINNTWLTLDEALKRIKALENEVKHLQLCLNRGQL